MERGGRINAPPLQLSAHLAKPLANPWRNRIMMELHLRPMSPKQFADEFGGELPSVARYFRELRNWGFLEIAEERRGGKRRGAVEKVYRAIQRVHFDTPTWEALPHYLRRECSWSMIEGLLLRIASAIEEGSFDAEKDRHLSWKAIRLDRQAWSEYVERLDQILFWLEDLEVGSTQRVAEGAVTPMPITVALLAFRSPAESVSIDVSLREQDSIAEAGPAGPHFLMSPKTAKALANPWRNRILAELHLRPMSPKQFVNEIGGPDIATVARYFRQLKKWGYLEILEELRGGSRRGSVEKVYRAVRRAHFNTTAWESLSSDLRSECSGAMLDGLVLRIHEAMTADTFDAEMNRHLSWKALWVDRQAWTECVTKLDETLAWVNNLEIQSAERLEQGEAEAIPATVGLMAFRAPDQRLS